MNNVKAIFKNACGAVLILAALPLWAGVDNVQQIVEKANLTAYYAGNDGRADVKMVITDGQGRVRNRQFTILRKKEREGGEQLFYVYFKRPSDVRKMVFMVHKNMKKEDDRWLFLPALDLTKRIAASDKRTSFVGSNFYYEDVSGRSLKEDKHELVETTEDAYVILNKPVDPKSVEFSSYKIWIDKKTYMPKKAVYLNKQGKPYREVEAVETRNIQGFPTVVKSRVKDLVTGGNTVSTFSNVKYDIGLKKNIFTERYLRNPPQEVRR